MAAFPTGLYQDKTTKIVENLQHITDSIGGFKTTYSSALSEITLVLSPLTESEKDSVIAHYLNNFSDAVDLEVNAYNTGIISVYYKSPPKISTVGKVHFKVTCGFRV